MGFVSKIGRAATGVQVGREEIQAVQKVTGFIGDQAGAAVKRATRAIDNQIIRRLNIDLHGIKDVFERQPMTQLSKDGIEAAHKGDQLLAHGLAFFREGDRAVEDSYRLLKQAGPLGRVKQAIRFVATGNWNTIKGGVQHFRAPVHYLDAAGKRIVGGGQRLLGATKQVLSNQPSHISVTPAVPKAVKAVSSRSKSKPGIFQTVLHWLRNIWPWTKSAAIA